MTLRELLAAAGFTGGGLDTAVAVAMAESGGNATAHNPVGLDNSYGLFQVNMLGGMGPDRRARYGLASNEALYDPATNARVAYLMSNGGTNWGAWTTYTSGKFRQFLGLDKAVTNGGSGSSAGAGTGAAQTVGLVAPSQDEIGALIVRVVLIGCATLAGAALVLIGANQATGWPGVKAGKLAAKVAI
jgi:hypothetical protein